MTTFFLIRHATNDAIGHRIVGRLPGIHLNDEGRKQARRLAERLSDVGFSALYSSPLDRALETAAPIAHSQGLEVRTRAGLTELDFGEWSGLSFEELHQSVEWRRFNEYRTGTRPPGGESMIEMQQRMVVEIERLGAAHPDGCVAVVSHGDPLKSVIAWHLGAPAELLRRLEISPASVSVLSGGPHELLLSHLNDTGSFS